MPIDDSVIGSKNGLLLTCLARLLLRWFVGLLPFLLLGRLSRLLTIVVGARVVLLLSMRARLCSCTSPWHATSGTYMLLCAYN